jgi:hypothetical protein
MAVEWRQALVNAVLIPIRFRQGTVSHSGSGIDSVSRLGRSRQVNVLHSGCSGAFSISSVLADLVKEMFCFQEVVVMPSYLADPFKEMFCIQEVAALSPVLADLVKEMFGIQ